jgi:hypothetical protein
MGPGVQWELAGHICGYHILNDSGGMIMGRFKITQGIIEKGIDKKMKDLTKLKSLCHQNSFLRGQPETIPWGGLNEEEARKITVKRLEEKYTYLRDMEKAIYIVSVPCFPFLWEEIDNEKGKFISLKKIPTALPRISNKSHWDRQEGKESKCLYVGSSHDIAGRVIQHFWKCHKGTSSLHLIEWDWWKGKSDVQIDIWDASEISDIHLQIIEDIVWETYKPLFGKEGAK